MGRGVCLYTLGTGRGELELGGSPQALTAASIGHSSASSYPDSAELGLGWRARTRARTRASGQGDAA